MNKKFIKRMHQKLIEEKKEIIKSAENIDSNIDSDGDETDEIQANLVIFVAEKLSNKTRIHLAEIDKALDRIEKGEYGVCEDCDEEIYEKRLEFNPCFTVCVRCAEIREKENRG